MNRHGPGLAILTAAAIFSTHAIGAELRAPTSDAISQAPFRGGGISHAVSGRALSQKDILFRSLLSTEGVDLAWPGFPRVWHEESATETVVSNTNAGLPSGTPVSASVNVELKYSLKTSFVIIASARPSDSTALDPNRVATEPVSDPLQFEILRWDARTRRALPNIRRDYPMVGFCAFEATLSYTKSAKGGVSFLVGGQTVEAGRVYSISHTIFSRFFQLDGIRSPQEILDQVCASRFRGEVEQYANRDFGRAVLEFLAYRSDRNECQPDPGRDDKEGDLGCQGWYRANFGQAYKSLTVPRCVLTRQGTHRCELRAREKMACPMYWDKAKGAAVPREMTEPGKFYAKATSSPFEFACDEGMSCQMNSRAVTVFNTPVWRGSATCVRN